jgi:diguanylate cyclase (GGDEF)-like protein
MSGNVEADYHQVIYELSIVDALTEIHNKRYLLEFLERELARSARHKRPLSLVLLDLDHFKTVNDTIGHLGGDATLQEVAARIKPEIRQDELFARYGGEEFAVVLPETTNDCAVQFAERLRRLVADEPFHFDRTSYHVTISLGTATTDGEAGLTRSQLIHVADQKLYQAKRDGRNRVAS